MNQEQREAARMAEMGRQLEAQIKVENERQNMALVQLAFETLKTNAQEAIKAKDIIDLAKELRDFVKA